MTKYEIAANITLNDLDGFEGKMSAKVQREVFGVKAFGQKTIKVDANGQGQVTVWEMVSFGQDCNVYHPSFEEIADGWIC